MYVGRGKPFQPSQHECRQVCFKLDSSKPTRWSILSDRWWVRLGIVSAIRTNRQWSARQQREKVKRVGQRELVPIVVGEAKSGGCEERVISLIAVIFRLAGKFKFCTSTSCSHSAATQKSRPTRECIQFVVSQHSKSIFHDYRANMMYVFTVHLSVQST